jgi:hypothetical protein
VYSKITIKEVTHNVTVNWSYFRMLGQSIIRTLFIFLCFLVRASSYIPVSRPTDATSDRFLFSIYMCIALHVSSVKRSSSGVPHLTYSLQFLCLCLSAALSCKKSFLQDCRRQTQTQKLEAVCTVRDS